MTTSTGVLYRISRVVPVVIAIVLGSFFFYNTLILAQDGQEPLQAAPSGESRVIVKFRSFTPGFVQNRIHRLAHANETQLLQLPRSVAVDIPEQHIARYQNSMWVEYVEPDPIAYALAVPNDPGFSNQWGQSIIQTPQAWETSKGDATIRIAILDTGISPHTDVAAKVDEWVSFVPGVGPDDDSGHGTHVAGIAAALTNNGIGVAGTGWDTRLLSVKVLDHTGTGNYSWIIEGIYWAADRGADIINISFGGVDESQALKEAVDYAWSKGAIIIAAAGNTGDNALHYPAAYEHVIAVGGTNQLDQRASFSTHGTWVDLAAPGASIYSTFLNNQYSVVSGTSMSVPHVSGVAALIKAAFPNYTNQQIRDRLEGTADPITGTGDFWEHGRVNAFQAVRHIEAPPVLPEPTPTVTPIPPTPLPTVILTPVSTPTPIIDPVPPTSGDRVVRIPAIADICVNSFFGIKSDGQSTLLWLRQFLLTLIRQICFLKFDLRSLLDTNFQSVKLVFTTPPDATVTEWGYELKPVDPFVWREDTLTYRTRPETANALSISPEKVVIADNTVTVDITEVIQQQNLPFVSYVLEPDAARGGTSAIFYSRESSNPPELVIEYEEAVPITVPVEVEEPVITTVDQIIKTSPVEKLLVKGRIQNAQTSDGALVQFEMQDITGIIPARLAEDPLTPDLETLLVLENVPVTIEGTLRFDEGQKQYLQVHSIARSTEPDVLQASIQNVQPSLPSAASIDSITTLPNLNGIITAVIAIITIAGLFIILGRIGL